MFIRCLMFDMCFLSIKLCFLSIKQGWPRVVYKLYQHFPFIVLLSWPFYFIWDQERSSGNILAQDWVSACDEIEMRGADGIEASTSDHHISSSLPVRRYRPEDFAHLLEDDMFEEVLSEDDDTDEWDFFVLLIFLVLCTISFFWVVFESKKYVLPGPQYRCHVNFMSGPWYRGRWKYYNF